MLAWRTKIAIKEEHTNPMSNKASLLKTWMFCIYEWHLAGHKIENCLEEK